MKKIIITSQLQTHKQILDLKYKALGYSVDQCMCIYVFHLDSGARKAKGINMDGVPELKILRYCKPTYSTKCLCNILMALLDKRIKKVLTLEAKIALYVMLG